MFKKVNRYIISKHQRYIVSNNLIDKVVIRITKKYYQTLFFKYENRQELSQSLWGGEGGYQHAKNQYERDDWMNVYKEFYNLAIQVINKNSKILEVGCSMGQWAKRLGLDIKDIDYTGIDINAKSITEASKIFSKNKNLKFQCVDLNKGYDVSQFNLILFAQVLFFLDLKLISKIFADVSIGTTVIITEPINKTQKNISDKLKSLNSVGFSHDYLSLLHDLGYETVKSKIEKTENGGYRIHAQFVKTK